MIFSFDLSLRCTGACCFDLSGNLRDFIVVCNGELQDEELISYNSDQLLNFVDKHFYQTGKEPTGFVTEALALHAKSADKDRVFGQFWHLQSELLKFYPWVPRGKISVAAWRASVLTKEEQREAKKLGCKDPLKVACYNKLPDDIRCRFEAYLEEHRDRINVAKGNKLGGKSKEYLNARLDISDAYLLGKYRLSLEGK